MTIYAEYKAMSLLLSHFSLTYAVIKLNKLMKQSWLSR